METEKFQTVEVDGMTVRFSDVRDPKLFLESRQRINQNSWRHCAIWQPQGNNHRDACGLTGETLKAEDGLYIVFADGGAFPSKRVSRLLADSIGLPETARRLKVAWEQAKKYWNWFT